MMMSMSDTDTATSRTVSETENGLHPIPEGSSYRTTTTKTNNNISDPAMDDGHSTDHTIRSTSGNLQRKLIPVGSDELDGNHSRLLESASCTAGQSTAQPSQDDVDYQGLPEPGGSSVGASGLEQGSNDTIETYPPQSDPASKTTTLYSNTVLFSLDNISTSPYYSELTDTAATRNITLFGTVCQHRIGERVACLLNRLGNLSTHERQGHYDVGRVLYLTMLWEEGVKYIENLTSKEVEEEYRSIIPTLPSSSQKTTPFVSATVPAVPATTDSSSVQTTPTKDQLMLRLKVTAQGAVDHVVSNLTSSSLDVLNTLAGDDEDMVIIHATST